MHQVAKGYIRGVCAEIREDGETSPRAGTLRRSRDGHGVVGGRNDNHKGHEQGIAVGARDRVLTAGTKTEDTKLQMLVERFCRVVADRKQMITATLEMRAK